MRRTFLRSHWVQVGGYNQGLPPYQEGGFWGTLAGPAVSYVGNLAANAGYETACRAARQFYKSHCRKKKEEEEEEPPRKKKKKTKRGNKTQRGRGDKYDGGTVDYQEGGLVIPFSEMTYEQLLRAQRGAGKRPRRRTPRRPRNITAASLDENLYRRLGGRPIGVLPNAIPGFQVGMGKDRERARGKKRRRTSETVIVSTSFYKKELPWVVDHLTRRHRQNVTSTSWRQQRWDHRAGRSGSLQLSPSARN